MSFPSKRAALTTLALAVCLAAGSAHAAGRYVLISHAPDSDSWWNTIKNSVKQAGEDYGVTVDYRNPPNGDLADMARLIEQAAAQGYDGVITTIADYNVLQGAMKKITDKKIPLITINSGTPEQSEKLGALMHVGQPEYAAGKGAGERAKAAGIKSFLCVNHYATNPASFERCRGFADAIGADAKTSTLDAGDDPTGVESKVSAYLRQHPSTQAVLALGPSSAHPTLKALEKGGQKGKIWFATFDLSDEISRGIKDGSVQFAIDQQPYLQGYIPVAVMATMKAMKTTDLAKVAEAVKANPATVKRFEEYGLAPAYGPRHIGSGPGFVTRETLPKVEKYAGQYR
ncbi:sugar ABC transporter substrate-binding protein [Rhizobacter sp. Root1221]|uniref:sugar ABC transporter substrate-binding protein n=1 Tax=Rhizobacter sp. Root1221 TaxID=1736433 RepID=UPI0006F7DC81|nr:sugar ABC transporter substrate-binding protein [Rhizobacter sp. Root1221]KQV99393.1 sugar ABC transporter substrate-binding protein [Rhizobacter sp. Root1221]